MRNRIAGILLSVSAFFSSTAALAQVDSAALLADAKEKTVAMEPSIKVGGVVQFRYMFSDTNDGDGYGFELPLTRLDVSGKLHEQVGFRISPMFDSNGDATLQDAYFTTTAPFGINAQAGQFRPKFFSELNVADEENLTVNHSVISQTLGQTWTQGVQLSYAQPRFALHGGFTEGNDAENTPVQSDTDFAVLLRGDVSIWNALTDSKNFVLGGGVDIESDTDAYTLDATWNYNKLHTSLAYIYENSDAADYNGIVGNVSYAVTDQFLPYLRQEWGESDDSDINISYVGVSYFPTKSKNFKWSNELGYAWGTVESGWDYEDTGFVAGEEDQAVFTSMFQLRF